jgi:ADP-ribose pyrophosphatase YjhB (NUDIX family)
MKRFTIRVYGILMDQTHRVLISKEVFKGIPFTKFPGGGLEYGEGLREALRREYQEELALDVAVGDHIYTTDFFQESAFFEEVQVISIYYVVRSKEYPEHFPALPNQTVYWEHLSEVSPDTFTFETEKRAWRVFAEKMNFKNNGGENQ